MKPKPVKIIISCGICLINAKTQDICTISLKPSNKRTPEYTMPAHKAI
jgi:hypothetical protein